MPKPPPQDRQELVDLIAGALQRSVTYMSRRDAEATADTILRDFKAREVSLCGRRGKPPE